MRSHLPRTVFLSLPPLSSAGCPGGLQPLLTVSQTWGSPPEHKIYRTTDHLLSWVKCFQSLEKRRTCEIKLLRWWKWKWNSKVKNLTDSGYDGTTEEESIGWIPSAGIIWCASGIHTCFNGINHFLKQKDDRWCPCVHIYLHTHTQNIYKKYCYF